MNLAEPLVFFPLAVGVILAMRGLDAYIQSAIKWYRMKVTKRIEKCEFCNGVGAVQSDKVVKQK